MKYILTSDWHIRADNPICRKDDFLLTQIKILDYIYQIANDNNAMVLIAGDIFHKARPDNSQELEILLLDYFAKYKTGWIVGNHDLLFHSIANINKSSIGVLQRYNQLEKCNDITGFHFGELQSTTTKTNKIVLLHEYVSIDKNSIIKAIHPDYLLDLFPNADLILTGDNHTNFVYEKNNRRVVNTGCLTKQSASMKDSTLKFYLYDTDNNDLKEFIVPDNEIIYDEHIIDVNERAERVQDFVNSLKGNIQLDLSFKQNVINYCNENKVVNGVMNKINQVLK